MHSASVQNTHIKANLCTYIKVGRCDCGHEAEADRRKEAFLKGGFKANLSREYAKRGR